MGLSAQAIATGGRDHPHDLNDLLRCVMYCEGRLSTSALRERMTGRSIYWDRLLPEWGGLVALLRREMESRTDGLAVLTYAEMKRVLHDGISCASCTGTGRGAICTKCKGTGRRSGGRCRAEHCYHGADFCNACRGNGFTTTTTAKKAD